MTTGSSSALGPVQNMDPWKAVYVRSDEVAKRTIADEVFLVPVTGELAKVMQLFVLEGCGAVLWELLDGQRNLEEVYEIALGQLDVDEETLRCDLIEFAAELTAAGLIGLQGES